MAEAFPSREGVQTRSKSGITVHSEATLRIEHENYHDLIVNRLIKVDPESFTSADTLVDHLKYLTEASEKFVSGSLNYTKLLKQKKARDEFRAKRKLRLEVREEVNQYIDDCNMTLSSFNVDPFQQLELNSLRGTTESYMSRAPSARMGDVVEELDNLGVEPTIDNSNLMNQDNIDPPLEVDNSTLNPSAPPFKLQTNETPTTVLSGNNITASNSNEINVGGTAVSTSNHVSFLSLCTSEPVSTNVTVPLCVSQGTIWSQQAPLSTSPQIVQSLFPMTSVSQTHTGQPRPQPAILPSYQAYCPPATMSQNLNNYVPLPIPNFQLNQPRHSSPQGFTAPPPGTHPQAYTQGQAGSFPSPVGVPSVPDPNLAALQQLFATNQAMLKHLLTNDLTKDSIQTFDGKSYQFWTWVDQINSKMGAIASSPSEILHIMRSNSKGPPQKLIETYIPSVAASGAAGRNAFDRLWNTLVERYGSTAAIYEEILSKFNGLEYVTPKNMGPGLQAMYDVCEVALMNMQRAPDLQSLNRRTGLEVLHKRLPISLQIKWAERGQAYEDRHGQGSHPPFTDFMEFLKRNYRPHINPNYKLTAHPNTKSPTQLAPKKIFKTEINRPAGTNAPKQGPSKAVQCPLHEGDQTQPHKLAQCRDFKSKSYAQKMDILREHKRCFRCTLHHFAANCRVRNLSCDQCQGRHLTTLHRERPQAPDGTSGVNGGEVSVSSESITTYCTRAKYSDISCSKTVLIEASSVDNPTVIQRLYCIIDDQSNCSLIDKSLVNSLGLSAEDYAYTLKTVKGVESKERGKLVSGLIIRKVGSSNWIGVKSCVTNSYIPNVKSEVATKSIVRGNAEIQKFANQFHEIDDKAQVLLLLGRDVEEAMQAVCHTEKAPWVYETPLGWAIVGNPCSKYPSKGKDKKVEVFKTRIEHEHFLLNNIPLSSSPDPDKFDIFKEEKDDESMGLSINQEKFCEIMREEVKINEEGRVEAPLPLVDKESLPYNRWPVYHRTKNMLDRLKLTPKEAVKCVKVMGDTLASGYVERVPESEWEVGKGLAWWLPIFPTYSGHKKEPRLVVDAGAKYEGVCLNDHLLKGMDINHQMRALLTNIREEKVAVAGDIQAMFSNFSVSPEFRDYLRFFWWDQNDPSQGIVQYRYRSHCFGCKCSPAVAGWCLLYSTYLPIAKDYPEGVKLIRNSCYVDDLLKSFATVSEAVCALKQAKELLSKVSIKVHKLVSNSQQVLDSFPIEERAMGCVPVGESDELKMLGVVWNPKDDVFTYQVKIPDKKFTKRNVLPIINSLYDPLSWASPVVLGGRIIQRMVLPTKERETQELKKCGWDDELPKEFLPLWETWTNSLQDLTGIKVPRSLIPSHFFEPLRELIGFCDSSEKGLGFIIYQRSLYKGEVHVAMVVAGSKVIPRGATSMPRCELNAALELSVRMSKLVTEMVHKPSKITYFCDSQIVLGYLRNKDKCFKKYVSRRVAIIRKLTNIDNWLYVPSELNIADRASRPCSPKELQNSDWVHGPPFLKQWDLTEVGQLPPQVTDVELPEEDAKVTVLKVEMENNSLLSRVAEKMNNWVKVVRVYAKLMKLFSKVDGIKQKLGVSLAPRKPNPTWTETEVYILKLAQFESFSDVIGDLSRGKALPESHKLCGLAPFIDTAGVLRIGGRITRSNLPYGAKHPIILPTDHSVTRSIVAFHHAKVGHQGKQLTNGEIRMNGYHILNGKKVVRKFIAECNQCKLLRGPPLGQKMADLPKDRLSEVPPFYCCGLDVWGPVYVKEKRSTRAHTGQRKIWVLLISCLVSRAVHCEILPSLDTPTFRNALRRFMGLRGRPGLIRSDNAGSFVAAHNQMKNVDFDLLKEHMYVHDVEWIFNPPYASNFGGVYERHILSVQRALEGTMAECFMRTLSYDEFSTLLQEACCIVNNTPLTEVSDDAGDPEPICPADLLLLRKNANPPELEQFSKEDLCQYGKLRYRKVQYLADCFWSRWRAEYITTLHKRHKWKLKSPCLRVNDVVLVKDKKAKRNRWTLGRVKECRFSEDELVRSVSLSLPPLPGSNKPRSTKRCIHDLVLIVPSKDHPKECFEAAK